MRPTVNTAEQATASSSVHRRRQEQSYAPRPEEGNIDVRVRAEALDAVAVASGSEDRLADFRTLVIAIRWCTLAVGVVLASPEIAAHRWSTVLWLTVLVAYSGWRTAQPVTFHSGSRRSRLAVIAEVVLTVGAVVCTGYWDSPFVFSLLTAIIIAGFAEGFRSALAIAALASGTVSLPLAVVRHEPLRTAGQWSVELLLVALVAGYGRHLFVAAQARTEQALDRVSRLAEANSLLYSLHRVAQTLPASLDMAEVLDSTLARIRELVGFDAAAVYLRDDATGEWDLAASDGVRVEQRTLRDLDLPRPVRRAFTAAGAAVVADLAVAGPGVTPTSRSGLYAPLRARGGLVAVVALERRDADYGDRDRELVDRLSEPVALAIDNARWFARLRTVGADEERTRIARDLHDRIGQSLAYLAFELDRIAKRAETAPVHAELGSLRQDVRAVVREVRETLYDLRTDVTEERGVAPTIAAFLERVRERAGLRVSFQDHSTGRLPMPQERELWRIAQEAVANVERHAAATRLDLRWWCDGTSAVLEVSDDGKGFPVDAAARIDAYGMLGMRERADAIGAQLAIESEPGQGTTIRCLLGTRLEVLS